MTEEPKKEASAIPEIYYDIIARIVPGALILAAYTSRDINERLDTAKLTVGLLLSYMLGLVLNLLAERLWHWTYLKWRTNLWKNPKERKTDRDLWRWIRSLPLVDRNLYTKMMAEQKLFSTLSVGTFFMCFAPPCELVTQIDRGYSTLLFAILCVIFSKCFFRENTFLSSNMRQYNKPRETASSHQHAAHS